MKNLLIIFLLFLLATFTFSLDDWRNNIDCPKGTQKGCAALGRKTICRCVKKICKEDEYMICNSEPFICSCLKRFTTKKSSE